MSKRLEPQPGDKVVFAQHRELGIFVFRGQSLGFDEQCRACLLNDVEAIEGQTINGEPIGEISTPAAIERLKDRNE